MKILLDARWIFPQITGIGSYTQELIRHLAEVDINNSYVIIFQYPEVQERTLQYAKIGASSNFTSVLIPYGPFSPKSQLFMPRWLAAQRAEVYHSTNFMYPFPAFPRGHAGKTACVLTIHDLIPLLFPGHTPRALKTRFFPLFKAIMREAGRRADLIVTVSESSRRDIIEHMHVASDRTDRVVAIPEGVSSDYQPAARLPKPHQTILYVGRMDPYKNVVRLVEAFAEVHKLSVPNTRLQIIGPRDERYPQVEHRIRELNIGSAVDWPGYVSGAELRAAYQQADVFVLPSLYEGFGLPVLEAMACGTPVICSNLASLPEVAGDAAVLINPDEPGALARAITTMLTDHKTAEACRGKGLHRAAQFTWQRTAQATVHAYQQAAGLRA
jgi:glycosyltransferase involved in cell wall biosynthesis